MKKSPPPPPSPSSISTLTGTWRRVGGGYKFISYGALGELDEGLLATLEPGRAGSPGRRGAAYDHDPGGGGVPPGGPPRRLVTARELSLLDEMLGMAEAEAAAETATAAGSGLLPDGGPHYGVAPLVTLPLLLRAYERVLSARGLNPAADTVLYRLILKVRCCCAWTLSLSERGRLLAPSVAGPLAPSYRPSLLSLLVCCRWR